MGSVQCAVQTSGLDSTSTRLFRLLAPTDSDSNLVVVVVVGGLEGWLFVPARAGQDRDLERQERGAFADMGKEHMGISAGGVAYQRSFFSRGVSPTGGSCLLPLNPSHPYEGMCVCIHFILWNSSLVVRPPKADRLLITPAKMWVAGLYQSASPFKYSLPVQHCIRTHTHQAKH